MITTIVAVFVWVLIFAIYALVLLGEYDEQTCERKYVISFWEFVTDAWPYLGVGVLLLADLVVSTIYWDPMIGLMPIISLALLAGICWGAWKVILRSL